jgi:anti-sigma B factor antagonist
MDITEDRSPNAVTLILSGRLDGTSSSAFESRVLGYIEAGDTRLIIDMAELAYISSVGLRVFLVAAKRLKPVDGRLALCALRPSIAQVFEIAGFSSMFTITDTRDEAEAAVSAPAR